MPTSKEASLRVSTYYLDFVNRNRGEYNLLDAEYNQIRYVFTWLSTHNPPQFLQLLQALSAYLKIRFLYTALLDYCHTGLEIVEALRINPGQLLILTSETLFSLGDWNAALDYVKQALLLTRDVEPQAYAHGILALGRLQMNQGAFGDAIKTLQTAEGLLSSQKDFEGVAAAMSEVAAYLLVKGDYKKALQRYQEVNDLLQKSTGRVTPEAFMLGVVFRRLKRFPEALHYLGITLSQAETQHNPDATATALHHIAWVYYDQGEWAQAKSLGIKAKRIYQQIKDIRGESDADEQLGLIAFQENDIKAARHFLEQSLSARLQLGNQPGAASTLHRLARVYFRQSMVFSGLKCQLQSFLFYFRMKLLTRQRIIRMLKTPFSNDTLALL